MDPRTSRGYVVFEDWVTGNGVTTGFAIGVGISSRYNRCLSPLTWCHFVRFREEGTGDRRATGF